MISERKDILFAFVMISRFEWDLLVGISDSGVFITIGVLNRL